MTFQVNISIDDSGLKTIYDVSQSVTLVYGVTSTTQSDALGRMSSPVVAWMVFQPMEFNQVSWSNGYVLYATSTMLQAGANIGINSKASANSGWRYTFASGQFSGSQEAGSSYRVINRTCEDLSFGLALSASVNQRAAELSPLNASPVLYNEEAFFTPSDTVWIFLSSESVNGTVLPMLPGSALQVALTTQSPKAEVGFDGNTNLFFLRNDS